MLRRSVTVSPSAVTIVSPSTHGRTLPYRTDLAPGALVETMPPTVAHRPLDGSGGRGTPWRPAAALSSASVTLELVTARRAAGSTSRRRSDILVRSTTTPSPTFPPPIALP